MTGMREFDNAIAKDNDSFRLARIDAFVHSPLFSHEKNSVSSLHAQHVDEIDARMMKIIKIAPNFCTIAKREAKKIDTSSNVAHTGCAHRCFANGLR
jgi:hypothetical protein